MLGVAVEFSLILKVTLNNYDYQSGLSGICASMRSAKLKSALATAQIAADPEPRPRVLVPARSGVAHSACHAAAVEHRMQRQHFSVIKVRNVLTPQLSILKRCAEKAEIRQYRVERYSVSRLARRAVIC